MYVWIVLWGYVLHQQYFGAQLVLQLCGLMAILMSIDASAGWTGWSVNYVLPLLLLACNVLIDLYAGTYKSRWKDNLLYALLFAVLGFLPMILYLSSITHALVPMLLAALSSAISILGMLRFAVRVLAQEMRKRFHV